MPFFDIIPDSSTTLSVNYRPGQNKRLLASKSEAIFSFGDFTIEKNFSQDVITGSSLNLNFGTLDTLETLNAVEISTDVLNTSISVQQNELNLPKKEPYSYAYFSSFYANVSSAINKIVDEFPYAILSYNNGADNIFDYTEFYNAITFEKTSSFKIPISGLTNQGQIFLNSGNSQTNYSLATDYSEFGIQISGSSNVFTIKEYSYSGTYLYFLISDYLKPNSLSSVYPDALYIRPTVARFFSYKRQLTPLESQLIGDGIFNIPNTETVANDFIQKSFVWPKTIDGWSPDSYGNDFEAYKQSLLTAAEQIDNEKTDIFIRTIVPENFIEFDSENEIYRTIIQTYSYEFDKLKNYIDAIAYAHNVEYNNEETVPKKFMIKLGNLLGWKLYDGFNELDIFDYLTSDIDQSSNSYSYFNTEIWRRILINIVWLYKRKGTRDAISFIFRLIGAPDCLINFNEFVYDITKTSQTSSKVDIDGYIDYSSSNYIFQEGGFGRGNGQKYINQWLPEFTPIKRNDNNKVELGTPTGGTRNIVNTKEVQINFSVSQAIEDDVFDYFQQDCASWMWSSTCVAFSCLTVPYEYITFEYDTVHPENISTMTLSQYIDYLYTNSISPTNRKTNAQCHNTWHYPELKNIYLSYYYATCPSSNRLTNCKLEAYLQLLEIQLGGYISQLVPSTTIFDGGTLSMYKNTVFHRQRFVYKEGIDSGSVFRREIIEPTISIIPQKRINDAKIYVFTPYEQLPEGESDWVTRKNIPSQNISPTARNIKEGFVSFIKNETHKLQIKEFKITPKHIVAVTNKKNSVKASYIRCTVNTNSINTNFGAFTIIPIDINETSQKLIIDNPLKY